MFPDRLFASLQRNFEHQVSCGDSERAIFELVGGEEGEESVGFNKIRRQSRGSEE